MVGDLTALEEIPVSRKGGTITATLKKLIQTTLGLDMAPTSLLGGVVSDLSTPLMLVGKDPGAGKRWSVRRVSPNQLLISLEMPDEEEGDNGTAAFLALLDKKQSEGEMVTGQKITDQEWQSSISEPMAELDQAIKTVKKLQK